MTVAGPASGDHPLKTATCTRCRPGARRLLESLRLEITETLLIAETARETDEPPPSGLRLERTPKPAAPTPKIARGERTPLTHRMKRLERDLAVIDTEWNNSNIETTELISIGIVRLRPDGTGYKVGYTVRPTQPVTAETTAVHGFTDEILKGLPPFSEYADRILENVENTDIGGYSAPNDITILERSFKKANRTWNTGDVQIIDALRIWQTAEPRSLTDAHERFVGPVPKECTAHDAGDDALMTAKVIEALASKLTAAEAQALTDPNRVDPSGKFITNADGEILINFGKFRGMVARSQPKQLKWILTKEFAPSTKAVAQEILETHHHTAKTLDPEERFAKNEQGEVCFNFGKFKGQPARLNPSYLRWMIDRTFPEETKAIARKIVDQLKATQPQDDPGARRPEPNPFETVKNGPRSTETGAETGESRDQAKTTDTISELSRRQTHATLEGDYRTADAIAVQILEQTQHVEVKARGTTPSAAPSIDKTIGIAQNSDNLYRLLLDPTGTRPEPGRPISGWPSTGFKSPTRAVSEARAKLHEETRG